MSDGGLGRHREGGSPLRVDGPDLVKQAAVQTRVSRGNLRRFLEAAGYYKPVAADDFLGFAERAVRDAFPGNRFSRAPESLTGFHPPLINEPVEPHVKLVDSILYFLSRDVLVPLSTGNDEVFGQ